MPKKPNFDFERRQREKAKALKSAEKEQAKKQKQQGGQPSNDVLSSATSPEAAASGNEAHAFSEKTASSE